MILLLLMIGGMIAGLIYLLTWDIAPPGATVEYIVPDERFPN